MGDDGRVVVGPGQRNHLFFSLGHGRGWKNVCQEGRGRNYKMGTLFGAQLPGEPLVGREWGAGLRLILVLGLRICCNGTGREISERVRDKRCV